MKILYICGPYGTTPEGYDEIHRTQHNINEASRFALEAARKGWAPLCPHKNTAGFQHAADIPPEFWMGVCLSLLEKADAILLIPGWETSAGARRELERADDLGLSIFFAADGIPLPEQE